MKTTLIIPDDIVRRLKKRAADRDQTLSDVVSEALRTGLEEVPRKKLHRLPSYRMGKTKVDVADREQLYRAMEED